MYGLIQADTSAIDKRLILSTYLIEHKRMESAINILNQIDDSVCDLQCVKIKKRVSNLDKVYYYVMEAFKWFHANVSLSVIKGFFLTLIFLYLIIGAFFVGMIVKDEYSKKKNTNITEK